MKIVLIGFMGTGKSATGKVLARKLNLSFIDTDRLIEERAGQPVREIFRLRGEPFFRSLEKKTVTGAARKDGVVIAVGGGAVLDPENRSNLKKNGIVVSLLASPAEIGKRTAGDDSRPLLNTADNVGARFIAPAGSMNRTPTKKIIRKLLAQRLPLYRKADICVDTTGKTPRAVAAEIIERLKL